MARCYKTISICSICKERFAVSTEKGNYISARYCPKCSEKYFKKKDE